MLTHRRGVLQEGRFGWAGRNGLAITEGWFWARRNGGYNLYRGRGSRSAVDFDHPVAAANVEARELHLVGFSAAGEDYWLAVKAISPFGQESEDYAWLRLRVDNALAGRTVPDPVRNLRAGRTPGGSVTLAWDYEPHPGAAAPAAFKIYGGSNDDPIDYSHPLGQVAYRQIGRTYVWIFAIPPPADPLRLSVRAETADGVDDASMLFILVRTDAAPPGTAAAFDVEQT